MQICPRNKWKSVDSLKLDNCPTDSYLSRFNEARLILSIEVSIENYKIQISRSDFQLMLMCLCRVSFLTTINLYKAYFRGRHRREYKENIRRTYAKGDQCLILSERNYCIFAPLGFVTKCFLIFIVDEVKNFAANIFFKLVC